MEFTSIKTLSQSLQNKTISSTELTEYYLKKIKSAKGLNAFISVDEERARSQAKLADTSIQKGKHQPLTGIPLAHKDLFCSVSETTTCGSRMLKNYHSPFDATIVAKLASQGAVTLGKTNMDEFAMGSANENSYFGAVKNPWDSSKVAGGSSGGSAAAVAAGLVPFATGSDTGGSIRQPAAFCGISGIKPTYGLVSRYGMVAYASSFDQAGPMAKSAEDLAHILQVMAGFDEKDSTSVNQAIPDYTSMLEAPLKTVKIGVPDYAFSDKVTQEIQTSIKEALLVYETLGAEIIEIKLDTLPLWVPCYYVLACAEASSNLARYDGVRYGYRAPNAQTLLEMIVKTRDEGFGEEVKRRILTGTYVLSSGYYDAYYLQAQKIRRMIQDEFTNLLSNTVDVIIGPTTPTVAFDRNQPIEDPTQRYQDDIFTVAANLCGFPALSIPCGITDGLPIGLQLMGHFFSEAKLLNLAHIYQLQTRWHTQVPSLEEQNL